MRNFLFSAWENLIYIIVGVLFLNVLVLDFFMFVSRPKQIVQNINLGTASSDSHTAAVTGSSQQNQAIQSAAQGIANACPNTCLTAIQTATASLKLTQTVINNTTTSSPQAQGASNEYFVPFGSAQASSQGSYTTVPGLQAYVNMSQYNNVSSVVFEFTAGGNGIISAQLYDATDNYVIPGSQVSVPGGNPQLVISSSLNMPSGNKLYQVQINAQLPDPVTINQARLHITTQ